MTAPSPDDAGAHCPRCGADYRPGFDTCADCGVALVPGSASAAAPAGDASPAARPDMGMPDHEFETTLRDLRAAPARFAVLATMPIRDAVDAANDLRRHGIASVFVPNDDPLAVAASPEPGSAGSEPLTGDETPASAPPTGGDAWDSSTAWGWGPERPRWIWDDDRGDGRSDAGVSDSPRDEDQREDADDDDVQDAPTGRPPPGLEGFTVGGVFGPRRVPVPFVVLFVRLEDAHEARRIEARRVGIL